MNELLKKYESIDQSKLNDGAIKILNRVKTLTSEFSTDDAKNNKIAEDVLNEIIKKYPDSVKIVKRTPKAKPAPKKVAKAKKPATVSTAKKSGNNIMTVAKEIQKAGESWKEAMERAKQVLKDRREQVVQKQKTELEKLYALVKTKKELQGFTKSDIQRDAVRTAKPTGARFVTKQGFTSNQHGVDFPNKLGRKYWETRDRHADRLAPNYPKDTPLLASGGALPNEYVSVVRWADGNYRVQLKRESMAFGRYFNDSFEDKERAEKFAKKISENNKVNYIGISTLPYDFRKSNIPEKEFLEKYYQNNEFSYGGSVTETMIVNMPDGSDIKVETKSGTISKISKRVSVNESKNSVLFYKLPADLQQKINKRLNPDALANGGGIDGGMSNLTMQNVSFAKGGKVKHTFKVGEIVSFPTQKNRYMDKPILDMINHFSNKELVIEKINEDKPYNLADVYIKDTGEKLRNLILNPKVLKIYPDNVEDEKSVKIKDWYLENYPSDDLGEELNDEVTFEDMWNEDYKKYDIYQVMGVGDSLIRERLFEHLAEIKGVSYDVVYRKLFSNIEYAKGGSVSNERMYNFLQDDLEKLEKAINEDDTEQVETFFSYWLGSSGHLKSLETKTNERMYNFLKDDLEKLEKAINDGDKEQIDIFFSYWGQHLESLKMANGGSLPFMTDPNFGNFQNTGAFADGGSIGDLTEQEFLKKYFGASVFTENPSQFFEIKKLSSSDDAKVSAFVKELKADGFTVKKRAFSDFTSVMGVKKKGSFELGGAFMTTDLAGHSGGGTGGLNANLPLNGFSGTNYTGLVGETGAMSSGELFMDGGAVAQNQQVIDGASQSYVNYYLANDGISQASYKDGGAIENQYEGRTPEDIWDNLTSQQKDHFLKDHIKNDYVNEYDRNNGVLKFTYARKYYNELPKEISEKFKEHVREGQYASGGVMEKNQQVIDDASQSYINYYLGEGASQGIYKDGGSLGEELMGGQSNSTLKPSGYHLVSAKGREIIVSDDGGNSKERWVKNNGVSGYRLVYKGNDYEFTDSFEGGGFTPDVSDGTQFMSGVYAKGGEISIYNLRKGDKVKTRKGDIETIVRRTGSGSYETIENEYSHSPESLEFVSRPSRKMADGGFTPDVSDGTQFMSGVYAKGGALNKDNVKVGDVLMSTTGVKVKVTEFDPLFGGRVKAIRLDKYGNGKESQFMSLSKFTNKVEVKKTKKELREEFLEDLSSQVAEVWEKIGTDS